MDQEEDGIRRRKEEEKPISLEAILAIEKAVQDVKRRLEEQSGQDRKSGEDRKKSGRKEPEK